MAKLRSLVLLFFSCFFTRYICSSYAETVIYTLKQGEQLRDQDTDHLVSQQGHFKLGFFSPGASSNLGITSNRFLGIWYSKLPDHPDAVWVANPETPVVDSSGVFTLDSDGKLKIIHGGGQIIISDPNQTVSGNVTAYLMDTGNFILREVTSDGTPGNILWESFDYPSNTLLPGMKLGMNLKTGHNRTLASWFSYQSPVSGAFRLGVDPSRTNRLIIWRRDDVYWTSGIWENGSFPKAPELTTRTDLFDFNFVSNEEEKYFTYSVKNNSTLSRWELNTWGQLLQSILAPNGTTWETTVTSPCKFNPYYPDAVCIEQKPSECRNGSELLVPTRGYLNDAQFTHQDNNTNLDLSDCYATCWSDCTCIGYQNIHTNGSGCQFFKKGAHFVQNDYFGVNYLIIIANNSRDGTATEKGSTQKKWWIWCIIGIMLGVAVVLLGYFCYTRKRKLAVVQQTDKVETSQEQGLLELGSQIGGFRDIFKLKTGRGRGQEFKMLSFSEILAATDDFSFARKLGEGGFGPVYKGVLPDGQQVAVKRLARHSGQGIEEFMNEITLIAELQHSNLVRLLGCCIQGEEKILIYEYLTNTSLDALLFDSTRVNLLDWQRRINIIEGIAQGLLYLHKYSRIRVIHRDLKTSNILLDENMNPKISDFGMARIFGQNESRANTNRVVGTYGYMSPEYAMNGIFSEKSDVYSFGVVLLEIVSGRKNTVFVTSTALSLVELAWGLWKQGDSLELRDPSMDSCPKDEVSKFIQVGLLCVQEYAVDRPTMSEVISMLTSDIMFLPDPKQPAYCISRSEVGSSQPHGRSDMGSSNCVSITVMEAR
ncbi:unnamed protein product [Prunus armeniaca]|uniref:Receptor-like serine/threonine-protein kinase n=1 Tax=Prunus armeniaca TaxID=36596 RepID=A0A6J5VMD8_PRUAR|nr:unnamed protein product [Prunus armeniaca]